VKGNKSRKEEVHPKRKWERIDEEEEEEGYEALST
jgi:hypothetical protein